MAWNREQIDAVALRSAAADYGAFERIGLAGIEGARVLDVGCFDGFNTVLKLAPFANLSTIVGIDPDEEAIAHARRAAEDERFLWQASSFEDYRPDEPFDLVYFSHVFQHLSSKERAARKAYDCLRPGGWIVIKTVDDSLKASAPDPDRLMERVFERYEAVVRPRMAHTSHTDRNNGAACYGLLRHAGFEPVEVAVSHASTAGLSRNERLDLFERMTYFRNPVIDGERDALLTELLEEWKRLFERDDYFFDSPTFVVMGRKPEADGTVVVRTDATMDSREVASALAFEDGFALEPMTEADLGEVMHIEMRSFSNPWAPLAFATELRYNADASYAVVRDAQGSVRGYIGWWVVDGEAAVTHVAVDGALRRRGLGMRLLDHAIRGARESGAARMRLQVRERNEAARSLYGACGFREEGRIPDYYDNPPDDAVVMALSLIEEPTAVQRDETKERGDR